jgi:hypothetical protein
MYDSRHLLHCVVSLAEAELFFSGQFEAFVVFV